MRSLLVIIVLGFHSFSGASQVRDLQQLQPSLLIPLSYERAGEFSDGLAPAQEPGCQWGYIHKKGSWVIAPQFDNAFPFSGSLALVYQTDGYMFINKKGRPAFTGKFLDANSFSEGVAVVDASGMGEYAAIDAKGQFVLRPKFDFIKSFNQGLASFQKNGKWGFADKTGKVVIPADYESTKSFAEGRAAVKRNGKWGFIDPNGKMAISPAYENAADFSEGLCAVQQNGQWGYIDKGGKLAIAARYESAIPFSDGLAAVKANGKWGYIDRKGDYTVEPFLESAQPFSEGLACVGALVNGALRFGYIAKPAAAQPEEKPSPKPKPAAPAPPQSTPSQPTPPGGSTADSPYKPCDEWINGWIGKIANIHEISPGARQVKIRWKALNEAYGITVYEGKGIEGRELFREKKIKYTGEKTIALGSRTRFLTVQIVARRNDTQWEYTLECN